MKMWKAVLFAVAVGVVSAAVTDAKQEHNASYQQTRFWRIDQDVRVIDTAGVCLYVAVGNLSGYAGGEVQTIAAVPKTQLPEGVGCQ